ncbi:MAG: 16S rRNA (guanine(527)-N(7))-methyltransferase RsmG [Acholeplasmatales bacterium]|nr:16S rRNA (guanine(527)-N(7))-methyltransferase RsmG [Acholeplasmatales bacterium]
MDFKEEALKLGINYDSVMDEKFNIFYEELIRVNEYMNLTAITERDEVYTKHFLDSLTILKAINSNDKLSLLDVGSGAGFPAIPLAITTNNLDITIIDALGKRIKFLNELIKKLELSNVKALHKRAEEYAKEKREFYDITTARAVARLPMLLELCLPLTKVGGYFIAMKAQSAKLELEESKKAIELLGGKVLNVLELRLPNDIGTRAIIIIKKVKPTPLKYPRAFAKIKEKPL